MEKLFANLLKRLEGRQMCFQEYVRGVDSTRQFEWEISMIYMKERSIKKYEPVFYFFYIFVLLYLNLQSCMF